MSPVTVTFNPFRWLTPAQLVACAGLFFLPWVEVQCAAKDPTNPRSEKTVWAAFMHQSGWQVMTGEVDFSDSTFAQLAAEQREASNQPGEKLKGAPPLLFYCLAVAFGIGAGTVLPCGAVRGRVLTVCCTVALLAVGGQVATGLPVETSLAESRAKLGGKPPAKNDLDGLMTERLRTKYKWPLYATLVLVTTALLTALFEPGAPASEGRGEPADVAEGPTKEPDGAPPDPLTPSAP
ncbi:MAG: hypothetical protein J0I06_26775 [Planctomycetes bacterium]|nr:hypothetical protein [Planctomycetota bacterium]